MKCDCAKARSCGRGNDTYCVGEVCEDYVPMQGRGMRIKPCPFCGSVAIVGRGGFGEYFVTCANLNCGGRLGTGIWFTSEEDAIKVWNVRNITKEAGNENT